MGITTSFFPLATYGFRIGATQISGTPDMESLINQDSGQDSAPPVIDPSFQARSLEVLRGTPSMASHVLAGSPDGGEES